MYIPCITNSTIPASLDDLVVKNVAAGASTNIVAFGEGVTGIYARNKDLDSDAWEVINTIWPNDSAALYTEDGMVGYVLDSSTDEYVLLLFIQGEARPEEGVPLAAAKFASLDDFVPFEEWTFETTGYTLNANFSVEVTFTPQSLTVSQPVCAFEGVFADTPASFEAWYLMQTTYAEWWTIPVFSHPGDQTPCAYLYWDESDKFVFYDSPDVSDGPVVEG